MSVSRKCPNCQTWNDDSDYCSNCNSYLNEVRKRENEIEERRLGIAKLNKDVVEKALEKWKVSENPLHRVLFFVANSIWLVLFLFLSFVYAVIAFVAG